MKSYTFVNDRSVGMCVCVIYNLSLSLLSSRELNPIIRYRRVAFTIFYIQLKLYAVYPNRIHIGDEFLLANVDLLVWFRPTNRNDTREQNENNTFVKMETFFGYWFESRDIFVTKQLTYLQSCTNKCVLRGVIIIIIYNLVCCAVFASKSIRYITTFHHTIGTTAKNK